MDNATENWIVRFTRQKGRPPRILHMGNVCNNAYQTAKMLNAAGADCDVLNGDDYYIMTHPEWDDADFEGDVGNTYYPAFHKLNLHGFVRPRWYAQAPFNLAIDYLIAKREGKAFRARHLWNRMERARRYLSVRESGTRLGRFLLRAEHAATAVPTFVRAKLDYLGQVLSEIFTRPGVFVKRMRMKLGRLDGHEVAQLLEMDRNIQEARHRAMLDKIMDWDALHRVQADAALLFPERDIRFDTQLESFMLHLPRLRRLFSHYDIIQAYGNQPAWPYLAGVDTYIAYEHGTLRDYVYEPHDLARLNLLAFANAKAIYVTNMDCCDSAAYIARPKSTPVVYGLHGIVVERIIQKMDGTRPRPNFDGRFGVPASLPLFYSPSRHTFLPGAGIFLKGDEKVVGAAARLAREGYEFRLSLSAWGDDIGLVQKMVAQHPALAGKVLWNPPLAKEEFYIVLQNADAVLDQFHLNAFGAIFIEALCANSSVLISSSVGTNPVERFFAQPPPYLAADSEEEIYAAMKFVLDSPSAVKTLAERGRPWSLKNHGTDSVVAKNCQAYRHCLPLPL